MYELMVKGRFEELASCDLPTGLGKTSVIAIWLIALAHAPDKVPRRLVYVVNRRTVVDQATDEAAKIRSRLTATERSSVLAELANRLMEIAADSTTEPLAISTIRGEFADNGEWRSNPGRPAVIVGTVDMIGSRLLFSGYGIGFKTKPLHAGFLGQHVLLVHDEAHLEPAFQELIEAVRDEQENEPAPLGAGTRFTVTALTATPRGNGKPFGLKTADFDHPEVKKRIKAKKAITLHPLDDEKKLADTIASLALKHKDSRQAVLVFVRKLDDVEKVVKKLPNDATQQLTGTLRGYERDKLAKEDPVFRRFLPKAAGGAETVYLVCTSAGEVGVNISADHLVCDLSTFESMAQRFGRVNRFGDRNDTRIDIVHPKKFDKENDYDCRCKKTLDLLRDLDGNGSPQALGKLAPDARLAAFAPPPTMLKTSDILFDAWALTSIRGKLPGRPPVEPFLHGVSDRDPPETHVAWREEVGIITGELLAKHHPEDLLEDYPLKPHERLRDRSDRVFKHLAAMAERHPHEPVWLLDDDGTIEVFPTFAELAEKDMSLLISNRTVILPLAAGGLREGLLDGEADSANDVTDQWRDEKGDDRRIRVWNNDPVPAGMRLIRTIDIKPNGDEQEETEVGASPRRFWRWYVKPRSADDDSSKTSRGAVAWKVHTKDVTDQARRIVQALPLAAEVKEAVLLAASFHDLGKRRGLFQRVLGNLDADRELLAKSGGKTNDVTDYRHEFGSLLDTQDDPRFRRLSDEMKDLVLHLIAGHHGRGRPHFSPDEIFDPEPNGKDVAAIAVEVSPRFARLQRKYGRWGLAYLESLLRAADYAASAAPSATVEEDE
jgi:CRISPR-associated endonuclease/helicase Cas3